VIRVGYRYNGKDHCLACAEAAGMDHEYAVEANGNPPITIAIEPKQLNMSARAIRCATCGSALWETQKTPLRLLPETPRCEWGGEQDDTVHYSSDLGGWVCRQCEQQLMRTN
jgi:hypothetical protein